MGAGLPSRSSTRAESTSCGSRPPTTPSSSGWGPTRTPIARGRYGPPDGKRIAYDRHASDDRDGIYVQNADGGEAKRILKASSGQDQDLPISWLPDGTALLLMHPESGKVGLKLLPLTGGEADAGRLRPILPSTFNRFLPRISPDGRVLAFGSDETGKPQTWVVEFHPGGGTGRPIQVKTSASRDTRGPGMERRSSSWTTVAG